MTTSFKRLIAALAFVLPVAAFVASPVMAKTHHTSVHKAAHHAHKKAAAPATTAS